MPTHRDGSGRVACYGGAIKRHRSLETIAACTLVVAVSACASVPCGFEQVPSKSRQHPEQTRLGSFFPDFAPVDASLSGVRLLANPQEAFRARFGFVSLAEKTLDPQSFLWKSDLTGQLLLYRALEAADRGVQVRILTNSMLSNNHLSVQAHCKKYRRRMIEAGTGPHELRADPAILEHYKQVENRVAESHAGLHTKAFVVDRRLSMVGSYNMDPRSRTWNSEIGLLIDSEEFAATVLEIMETDLDPGLRVVCVTPDLGESVREMGESPREHTVMVRVDEDTRQKLDAWVESGAVRSRSEAAALFIREGLQVRANELSELEDALKQVDEAKRRLREKAKTVFGETSSKDGRGT